MTATIARWQRVKEIFNDVVDLGIGDRDDALARLCAGDSDLHRDVEALLTADDLAQCTAPAAIPQSIGPFRIIRQLGRGAATSIYLGIRDCSGAPPVAIKVITTRPVPHAIARSLPELEILSKLDHPNIARFLEDGATADGLRYLVMEYVDGIAMDRYCAERPMRANLELFLGICAAVAYAHQNEVIHGDINSRNILITRDGIPKLLDLAPSYASPRRMAGPAPTTTSDIYALGVVLSEILTTGDEYRATSSLYTIMRMALRKGGSGGYPSVHALAEDLRRCLGDS